MGDHAADAAPRSPSDTRPTATFPRPPQSFTDGESRSIRIETHDGPADPLVDMYVEFDGASRAQGLPPRADDRIESWVEGLLDDGYNVVAFDDERAVGHAALVPYDGTSELVIFVHPDYQYAGIGSRLIRALLGLGQARGVGHVWLTVERDNHVAMNLYRKVGFETTARDRLEHEMKRPL